MFLLWKTNEMGKISLDKNAIIDFTNLYLSGDARCGDVIMLRDSNQLFLSVTGADEALPAEKEGVVKKLSDIFAELGLEARISWVEGETGGLHSGWNLLTRPVFWGGLAAGIAILVQLGIRGVLWSLLIGLAATGLATLARTDAVSDILGELAGKLRRLKG